MFLCLFYFVEFFLLNFSFLENFLFTLQNVLSLSTDFILFIQEAVDKLAQVTAVDETLRVGVLGTFEETLTLTNS